MKKEIIYINLLLFLFGQTAFSQAPAEWDVDPSEYQFSMNITGAYADDCEFSGGADTKVAAFVNDEVRGVTSFSIDGGEYKLSFLTIYSNQASGEHIAFKVYDAGLDSVMTIIPTETFEDNKVVGLVTDPFQYYDDTEAVFGGLMESPGAIEYSGSQNGNVYTWYYNDLPVQGETGPVIGSCASGDYSLKVANAEGCEFNSDTVTVSVPIDYIALEEFILPDVAGSGQVVAVVAANNCGLADYSYSLVPGAGDTDNLWFYFQNDTLFTSSMYMPGIKDEFLIRVSVNDGNGNTYEEAMVVSESAVGTLGSVALDGIRVFPNPGYSGDRFLELDYEASGVLEISIYSVTGELLESYTKFKSPGKSVIELESIEHEGSYLIRIEQENRFWSDVLLVYE